MTEQSDDTTTEQTNASTEDESSRYMSSFLSILLIVVGVLIVILGLIGWCCKWLWALIGFSWEGIIGCIGCFVRLWIYIFIIAFVIAVISKMMG